MQTLLDRVEMWWLHRRTARALDRANRAVLRLRTAEMRRVAGEARAVLAA